MFCNLMALKKTGNIWNNDEYLKILPWSIQILALFPWSLVKEVQLNRQQYEKKLHSESGTKIFSI